MTGSVKAWLAILLIAVSGYGSYSLWRNYQAIQNAGQERSPLAIGTGTTPIGKPVEPFELTAQNGQTFDSRELEEKVWVASFFFTSCAGACLRMNNIVAELQQDPDLPEVRFVSITVDPENDTPEALEKYARHYGADPQRWLFLTGPPEQIKHLAMEVFQVAYGREAHSDRLIVVDQEGKIRGMYRAMEDAQVVLLKRKLAQLADTKSEARNPEL
jgi:protein SCO1/2